MGDIALHLTPYGRPAAALLHERVAAAKAGDPLRPVTVVVPANSVGVSARRALATNGLGAGGGIAGLTLLTVYRLAELLGAPALAGAGRRPVSTPVVAAAVRRALVAEPRDFAPIRDHPSTEEALVHAHRELSEVSEEGLRRLERASRRAASVVGVHRDVRAALVERWYEEVDLLASAEAAVRAGAPLLHDLGTVIVHLPQDLSRAAAALLATLAEVAPVEVIAGRTGVAEADADVDRTLRRLGLAPQAGDVQVDPPQVTAIVSTSDAEEEVRSAVQRIVAAAGDGVALERMAVLYPAPEPYARIVDEQMAAAGIPRNGRAVRPLSDRLLGRWLLDLLALPETRFSRPAVLGLISAGPVLGPDGRWVATGSWERISRDAGIMDGKAQWARRLTRHAKDARQRAVTEESADEPRDWLVARLRRNAGEAEQLAAFVAGLFAKLDEAAACRTWRELAAWCTATLAHYLGGERARARWPEVEADAADRVEKALDRLAGLDEVDPVTDLRVFRRTLALELDDDLGRVGRLGEGVLVGTLGAALGVELDLVVVLGLSEGVLPTRPREDSLLPDSERDLVSDELPPRSSRTAVEHRLLLAALATCDGQRVLVHPRGDLRRSVERPPSRWLLDAAARLRADGRRELSRAEPWHETVPSFAERVRTAPFPATRQLYGLRALHGHGPSQIETHPLVTGDPALRRSVELVRARRSDAFTRFDGNLGAHAGELPSPTGDERGVTATQLEAWLRCPHAYFVQHVLRVRPVELPEELLEMSPLERGTLVHQILEDWLRLQIRDGVPAPAQPWSPAARAQLRSLALAACDDADARGLTGHSLMWRRDRHRILLDLERFLDEDDARRAELQAVPVAAERAFGLDGVPPAPVPLGDGRLVLLRGKIDRVDRGLDGTLIVTDYKTGSSRTFAKLGPDLPLGDDGTKLQLGLYADALRALDDHKGPIRTEYWFTSNAGGFARPGYVVSDEVRAQLRRALLVVVDGIEAGHFPLKAPEPRWSLYPECLYCDPDQLGTTDRYQDWERLRHAPELSTYVGYIEPQVLEAAP